MDMSSQSEHKDSKLFTNSTDTDMSSSDVSPRIDQHNPMQAYTYSVSQPMDQIQQQPSTPQIQGYSQIPPQYIQASPQYIAQYYSGGVPTAAYPSAYHPYLQQQKQQQQNGYQLNKSYPVFLMQVRQPQPHDHIPVQCEMTTSGNMSPVMVTSPVMCDGFGTLKTSDITPKMYHPGPVSTQFEEHQPKMLAVAQMNQPQPVSSAVDGVGFGVAAELEDPLHAQIYKTQPTVPATSSQRQPATSAATAMLLDNLTQLQLDSAK